MKYIICLLVSVALTFPPQVRNIDYYAEMRKCAQNGSAEAMAQGREYEALRNRKIETQGLGYQKTDYFSRLKDGKEILIAMDYTAADLDLLARVVYAEAGCNWFPDWVQQAVASVVINRVKSSRYPDTIRGVIYQPGQYGCVRNGSLKRTPTSKCVRNAKRVLEYGCTIPADVVGQSGCVSGKIYYSYHDRTLGSTIYFCYG